MVLVGVVAHPIFLATMVLAFSVKVEASSVVVAVVLITLVVVVEFGVEVMAIVEVARLIMEIMLPTWSAAVHFIANTAATAVVIVAALMVVVGVVDDRWVGVLLHLFFGDWLHPTSCAVVLAVVGYAMPRLAPTVSGSYGPRRCGPTVGLLLDLGVGDLESCPDPSDLVRVWKIF